MKKWLYSLSILTLLVACACNFVWIASIVPLPDGGLALNIRNILCDLSMITFFFSIAFIPQIVFLIVLAHIVVMYVYLKRTERLRLGDRIALIAMNVVSACLMVMMIPFHLTPWG